MFYAERLEQRSLGRAASAGDDFGTEMMRDLDRGHADASRTGVYERRFTLA